MRLSPIYKKDALVSSRGIGLPLMLSGFNGCLSILILMNLFSVLENARTSGEIAYGGFLRMYYIVAGIELVLIILISPALTVSSISGERERKTLELLLTTQLSAFDIISGKLMTALSTVGVLIGTSMPVLATVFIYGGVTLEETLVLLVVYLVTAVYCASVGICTSTFVHSTAVATAAAYGIIFVTTGGSYVLYLYRTVLDLSQHFHWVMIGVLVLLTIFLIYISERGIMPKKHGIWK